MIIVCSNLSMRFYSRNGWTKELIEGYMLNGNDLHHFEADDIHSEYWVPCIAMRFNLKKLIADGHTVSDCFPMDHVGWTDLEILKEKE